MGTTPVATTQTLTALLTTTHCTCIHNAQCSCSHYNTLLDQWSLVWLVVTFAGDTPHHIHPLWCEDTTGEKSTHSLSTLRSLLTRVDQYRRTMQGQAEHVRLRLPVAVMSGMMHVCVNVVCVDCDVHRTMYTPQRGCTISPSIYPSS